MSILYELASASRLKVRKSDEYFLCELEGRLEVSFARKKRGFFRKELECARESGTSEPRGLSGSIATTTCWPTPHLLACWPAGR